MQGKIILQKCCGGMLDYIHGNFTVVKRIFVPEANGLVATIHEGNLLLRTGFEKDSDYKTIGEIEIPDELVNKALEFARLQEELKAQFEAIGGGEPCTSEEMLQMRELMFASNGPTVNLEEQCQATKESQEETTPSHIVLKIFIFAIIVIVVLALTLNFFPMGMHWLWSFLASKCR